jgi:hypothetical protein
MLVLKLALESKIVPLWKLVVSPAHVHATFNCVRSQTQLLTSTHAPPLKIAKFFLLPMALLMCA